MTDQQKPLKRGGRRLRIDPISDIQSANLLRKIQIGITARNALSGAVLSDEELEREMANILSLVIPAVAVIVAPLTRHLAGRQMAIAGTANDNPTAYEIRDALREPEGFRAFYPEAMRAGALATIALLRPFWPPKLADTLEASLIDLEDGRVSKMLTPEMRKGSRGSWPDRKRFALCLACEVEFQKSANPNLSRERVIRMVTGQTRTGYAPEGLPPLIPLPFLSWETITNAKRGLLAFARQHFAQKLEDAAAAGQTVAIGKEDRFRQTEFARFRDLYRRTTPEGWAAMWASATGNDPKARRRAR